MAYRERHGLRLGDLKNQMQEPHTRGIKQENALKIFVSFYSGGELTNPDLEVPPDEAHGHGGEEAARDNAAHVTGAQRVTKRERR
eukprot:738499-Rhodomonas_salina.2